jgi:hypothetical protein
MHAFRAAVEAREIEAAVGLMTEDAVFRSPVVFSPYRGRDAVAPILRAAAEVFEDFRYVRELESDDRAGHALVFRATIRGRDVEGCDFLHLDETGSIDDLVVMVRPLSAALALAEAMRARLAYSSAPGASVSD